MSSLRERVEAALAGEAAAAPPPRWAREWREDKPLPAPPALELAHEPYPYQRQAAHILDSTLLHGTDRGAAAGEPLGNLLVASPTGSGKTFAIKWAARRAVELGWRLVIAVPLVALAEQIFAQLRSLLRGAAPREEEEPSAACLDGFDDERGTSTTTATGRAAAAPGRPRKSRRSASAPAPRRCSPTPRCWCAPTRWCSSS